MTLTTCAGSPIDDVDANEVPEIQWQPCGPGIQCGGFDSPAIERIIRRPAIGTPDGVIVVDPGGPGARGSSLFLAGFSMGPDIENRFDLLTWDGPELGSEDPCSDDRIQQTLVQWSKETPEPGDVVDGQCQLGGAGDRARFSTAAIVDQLDSVVSAVLNDVRYEPEIPLVGYFGISYGTVRAIERALAGYQVHFMILDGVVDPARSVVDRATDYERSIRSTLEQHGILDLWSRLVGDADGSDRRHLLAGAMSALYGSDSAGRLSDAVRRIDGGDDLDLQAVSAELDSSVSMAAYVMGWCGDSPSPDPRSISWTVSSVPDMAAVAARSELLACRMVEVLPPLLAVCAGDWVLEVSTLMLVNSADQVTTPKWADSVREHLRSVDVIYGEYSGHTLYAYSSVARSAVTSFVRDQPVPGTSPTEESLQCAT